MAKVKKRQGSIFLRLTIVFFACYLLISLVKLQGDIAVRNEQLESIKIANEKQRIDNKELERVLEYGTKENYIERIAKEKLGFAYPEEQVLIDISGS